MKLWKYKDYKGKLYEVTGLWICSETLEELVIYKALYKMPEFPEWQIWIRPKTMFEENIIIDWVEIKRFLFVGV